MRLGKSSVTFARCHVAHTLSKAVSFVVHSCTINKLRAKFSTMHNDYKVSFVPLYIYLEWEILVERGLAALSQLSKKSHSLVNEPE